MEIPISEITGKRNYKSKKVSIFIIFGFEKLLLRLSSRNIFLYLTVIVNSKLFSKV